MRIFSVGHGARTLEELIATLRDVSQVVDVRAFPGSRRHPQFSREALERSLPAAGIAYAWVPELGGRRKLSSKNHPSWRVAAFAAYADHTDSDEFARGLSKLLELAAARPTAFMCAERHFTQCHRRVLADKLWALGHEVVHLIEPERAEAASSGTPSPSAQGRSPHRPPEFLRLDGTHLRYDKNVSGDLF